MSLRTYPEGMQWVLRVEERQVREPQDVAEHVHDEDRRKVACRNRESSVSLSRATTTAQTHTSPTGSQIHEARVRAEHGRVEQLEACKQKAAATTQNQSQQSRTPASSRTHERRYLTSDKSGVLGRATSPDVIHEVVQVRFKSSVATHETRQLHIDNATKQLHAPTPNVRGLQKMICLAVKSAHTSSGIMQLRNTNSSVSGPCASVTTSASSHALREQHSATHQDVVAKRRQWVVRERVVERRVLEREPDAARVELPGHVEKVERVREQRAHEERGREQQRQRQRRQQPVLADAEPRGERHAMLVLCIHSLASARQPLAWRMTIRSQEHA